MTLVLGVYPLYRSDPVWEALLQIAGCDPGLEYQAQSYYSGIGLLVTYKQKRSTPAANRLKELVDYPRVAVLYGVGSTGVNPTDGKPLIASGGGSLTYHGDGSASVYVDVDDAFGRHYLAPGHGGTVWDSLPTIVYHELAHAYHFFKGDNPANYGAKEVLARTDENVFPGAVRTSPAQRS
jgi:hypothetical protein